MFNAGAMYGHAVGQLLLYPAVGGQIVLASESSQTRPRAGSEHEKHRYGMIAWDRKFRGSEAYLADDLALLGRNVASMHLESIQP